MKTLQELIAGARAVLTGRQKERDLSYSGLVTSGADGDQIDPSELADVLEMVRRTPEEYAADVELVLQRRADQALLAEESKMRQENDRLAVAQQAEQDRFAAAMKALREGHNKAMGELQANTQAVLAKLDKCATARNRLIETSGRSREITQLQMQRAQPMRELQDGQLARDLRLAAASVEAAKRKVNRLLESQAGDLIGNESYGNYRGPLAEAKEELRVAEVVLKNLNAKANELRSEAEQAQRQINQVEAEALAVV